jgi:predicted ABC-type transport system involved in lysophospholipase L1 biosynthesis ATPase subunit
MASIRVATVALFMTVSFNMLLKLAGRQNVSLPVSFSPKMERADRQRVEDGMERRLHSPTSQAP